MYGLLPLGEPDTVMCNMCVDDEFMMSPYSTFITAVRRPPTKQKRRSKKNNEDEDGGASEADAATAAAAAVDVVGGKTERSERFSERFSERSEGIIVPGRGAGKWRVVKRCPKVKLDGDEASTCTAADEAPEAVAGGIAAVSISTAL